MLGFWKRPPAAPEFWQHYLRLCSQNLPKRAPIESIDFVVFDTETSGFDYQHDKLITIGAVRLRKNQIDLSEAFEVRILQQENYNTDAVPIHGLVPDKHKGIPAEEAIRQFIDYIGPSILVGHNVLFDIKMINSKLQKILKGKLLNPYLDTAKLAIRAEHFRPAHTLKPSEFTLDALCKRYHIPMHDRHNAAGDAVLTAFLLLKLLRLLSKRGIRTWGELSR